MADDKTPDSRESDELIVGDASTVDDVEGADQPGENLASPLVEDDVPSYTVAADETEAEELTEPPAEDGEPVVEDEEQLAEAEVVAQTAASTRPVKRKVARTADLAEDGPTLEERVAPASLRPVKKAKVPAKKDSATPKRDRVKADGSPKVGPAQFVRESIEELKKVVWPTGAQLSQYFVVVLVFVLFIIAFVGLLDFAFGWVLLKLFG